MQIENHSYPLQTIYFYLTEGCNLKCRHCWIAPPYQSTVKANSYLPLDLFASIIDQAKPLGLVNVKLSGGEPLMHPDIIGLLDIVKQEQLGLVIETNGILCIGNIAEKIASLKNPFVSVSLDGARAESHEWVRGVDGCFEEALEGIRSLVELGIKPQIIMSLMSVNKTELADMLDLAENLGAASVKFNIIEPLSRGESMHELEQTLTIEELVDIGNWIETELARSASIPIYHSHPLAFKPLSSMFSSPEDSCRVCNIKGILGVLADGSYSICGIGTSVPELIFGKASKDMLKDIWHNHEILDVIRKDLPDKLEGICGECLMKQMCSGACVAQNYYKYGSILAPHWYCEAAIEKGLFPEGRLNRINIEN